MSSAGRGIVVMTSQRETAEQVRLALAADERFAEQRTCRNLVEVAEQLERQAAVAAIVDLEVEPQRLLAELDPLIVRFPDTRFVLLADASSPQLLAQAVQIGARQLLSKEAVVAQLAGVLARLVPSRVVQATRGTVVTVLSASGGCGATTIAINLANEVRLAGTGNVLLVDLDLACGGIALALGVQGRYGIVDVLAHESGADPELVRSSATVHNGSSVLLSPASVNFCEPAAPAWENLPAALVACKMAYSCTIVDAPRVPVAVAATLAAASEATLIVMQLSVKDIHVTRELRQGLVDRGVAPERLITVVNRYSRRHSMISLEQAQRALQSNHFEQISNDYEAVSRSINYGQSLAEAAGRSVVRREIRGLVERLGLAARTSVVTGANR